MADDPDRFAPGFDTIVSFNVLEHIEDDVGTLRTAATLLRPGAHLVLFVPSLPFLYGTIDAQVDHHRRYTKTTLSEAVRSAGLKLERIEYFDFLGMVPWFLSGASCAAPRLAAGSLATTGSPSRCAAPSTG